jgi:hypothetical protein
MYRYEIRQQVKTINKSWLEVVWQTESERVALCEYEKIVNQNPDDYFELVFVDVTEDCIKFTKKLDNPS